MFVNFPLTKYDRNLNPIEIRRKKIMYFFTFFLNLQFVEKQNVGKF